MATQQGGAPPNANRISIITKTDIRYEGILYHINPQDQNITLSSVKSFGTEGRRPGNELVPSPQIHEYIIFRGTDIKDLKVLEQAQQAPQPEPTTNEVNPVQTQQKAEPVHTTKVQQTESTPQDVKMKADGQTEFDFQEMKSKFEQYTLEHKPTDSKVGHYSPNDFFDNLSTSTNEKAREIPFDRVAQKKVDKETFGSETVDTASRYGRGGRGGRGRGGYRGGYRNYQGGQNRGYGGNSNYHGQNRNYGGGHYQGNQNRGYGGGQGRKYGGGQGGHGGYGGHQGGYGGQQGGQQGGNYGNQGNYGGQGGYQPKYYKTYQTADHNQNQ